MIILKNKRFQITDILDQQLVDYFEQHQVNQSEAVQEALETLFLVEKGDISIEPIEIKRINELTQAVDSFSHLFASEMQGMRYKLDALMRYNEGVSYMNENAFDDSNNEGNEE